MKPSLQRPLLALALGAAALLSPEVASAGTHVDVGVSIGAPIPRGYSRIYVGRDPYYYHRGVFYRPGRYGYYVVHAPPGAIIRELPPRYTRVYIGSSVYYRYGDVFYRDHPDGYVVVDPPERVITTTTTTRERVRVDDHQTIWVGEDEYEFSDGQFFKKTADGLVWAPAPLGAVTKSLPPDARTVWYEDIEYFECEGVYFRKTPLGYKVIEAPWKDKK